nr:hypothetical protein [Aquimarina mytili]
MSSNETIFRYYQNDKIITGSYKGGAIFKGTIVGKQTGSNTIELLFQCITDNGELKSGESKGTITKDSSGKLQLRFVWTWLNGDQTGGTSEYIELIDE